MSTYSPQLLLPVSERDHTIGSASAPVTLLEYGDYECPYCRAAHAVVEEVRLRLRTVLRFAYRHFPLTNVHPHAQRAAEAAEAAGAQGRFWAMHDRLFEYQDALEDDDLLAHAEAVRLDLARFARELAAGIHNRRVREDFMSGVRSGVNGTPTFYLNDIRYDGGHDAASLIAGIELALQVG
jgi:protein-disulfide isomerase